MIAARSRPAFRRALAAGLAVLLVSSAAAGPRVSANYAITTDTVDSGGGHASSAAYTNDGSLGGIAGSSTAAGLSLDSGYVAQLASAAAAPVITSPATASGAFGTALTPYLITATNSPASFSAAGLPAGLAVNPGTGAITGIPAATGTFQVMLGATNAGGTGNATLTLAIAGNYLSWQQAKFTAPELADPSLSGPNAVYGLDGLGNLVKYALGLEPKSDITDGLPFTSSTATDWVYTYTRPSDRTDLTYTVEVSTNLTTWTDAGVTLTLVSTSGGIDTWQATYPLASGNTVFFRLKVVR